MTSPLLPPAESLTVEFKSDQKCLSDEELVSAVTCLANTEGGTLYIGVEDDGTPSGLHAKHRGLGSGLPAMIANRTAPSIRVKVDVLEINGHEVARIVVPKANRIVSTTGGLTLRRRLDVKGKPECVPLLPHEVPTRLSDLGAFDASRQPVPGATLGDLDPVERGRIRQFVERYGGDRSLLGLSDDELDGVLGLVVRDGGTRVPSLAGMLLVGRESSLRHLVPTHEVAFQVLEGRPCVLMNSPVLPCCEFLSGSKRCSLR